MLGAAPSGRTLPDRITEHFIARIFTGELAPGQRLPPDRELAPQLGVDRTSLRMAMQQLSRFGVIRAVRGSGVTVLDFREHAGLDFLAAVIALPNLSLGSGYLLQLLDDWLEMIPVVIGRALVRASSEQLRELDQCMAEQLTVLEQGVSLDHVASLEVALQDRVIRMVGNTGYMLLGNSSRPLRQRLVGMYFEGIDVRGHVEGQRALLRPIMLGARFSASEIAATQRAFLVERTAALRERLAGLPFHPSLAREGTARAAKKSRVANARATPKPALRARQSR